MTTTHAPDAQPAAAKPRRPAPPWLAVKDLFERLLDAPIDQRHSLMHQAAPDPSLADEVWALLGQHQAEEDSSAGFLARPALMREALFDRRGDRLGPWRLTVPLGSGGMGEVWEAQRDDGAYEARVAVKLLQPGRDAGEHRVGFELETRALARLSHPHIARLLDAGRTADERPYFVMEAVDGRTLDQACRDLSLPARLALFLQLADAVSHAHRHGLVHGDLKPANVMVTADGQIKLLDFGIAQALDAAMPAVAADGAVSRPLTPGFASPEQVRGDAVGAASDVYSLGVLLHLLLTGVRPYARDTRSTQAALRAVLDDAPTLPSQAPADGRGDSGIERRLLAGDLDAIVLKALAKPVGERYASVQALADDLRAAQAQQPVAARRRTPGYVGLRFVQRHRGTVAASLGALLAVAVALEAMWGGVAAQGHDARPVLGLVILLAVLASALGAGLAVSSWRARRAARGLVEAQRQLAQTSGLVRDVLMRYADMATYLPGGVRIKADLLTDTIAHLEQLHLSAPGDAQLAGELAKAHARLADMQLPGLHASLDEPDEARAHAERALALFPVAEAARRDEPELHMWWARALRARQRLQRLSGDPQAALDSSQRMRGFLQSTLQRFPQHAGLRFEYASVMVGIGQANDTWFEPSLNRAEQALHAFDEAESVLTALAAERADNDPESGNVRFQLGTVAGARLIVMKKLGRLDDAIAAGWQALQWRESALALQPLNTAYREGLAGECSNLTMVLLEAGRTDEALAASARSEELVQALLTQDPDLPTWTSRRRLFAMHRGRALLHAGQPEAALPRLDDAMQGMAEASTGPTLGRRGWCGLERSRCLRALGREDEADAAVDGAVADLQARLAEQPGDLEARQRLVEASAGPAG